MKASREEAIKLQQGLSSANQRSIALEISFKEYQQEIQEKMVEAIQVYEKKLNRHQIVLFGLARGLLGGFVGYVIGDWIGALVGGGLGSGGSIFLSIIW